MDSRTKSLLSYGLAAFALLCATVLRALGQVEPSFVLYVFGLVFSSLGFYHAPAPGQSGPAPPAGLLLLLFVGLGTGCKADSRWHLEIGRLGFGSGRVLSTSITPITSLAGAASGFSYSGESYEVVCTIATDTATLYPVVHNGTAWEGPGLQWPCTLNPSTSTKGTCIFPARTGTSLTWNAFKTGAGTVSSCTASGRAGSMPGGVGPPASGAGSGTVTSVDCGTGLTCTPDPIVATGTIAPTFGTAANQVVQGGVVTAATCASPSSLTYNAAGQVTSCTAGSGSSGGGNSIYGDGSDGAGSIAGGTTTLARDAYYDTLTVSSTGILNAAGFRIFCKTSLTVDSGGYIHNNGTDASGGMGGTGGTALTLGGGANGAIGGTFGGSNGTGLSNALGGAGGNGGAGNGGGMAAGTGGTITAPAANGGSFRTMPFAMFGATVSVVGTANPTWIAVQGGAGGASGGGDGANSSGGGGGGGGVLVVVAKAITIAGTGAIRANGGAGGTSAGGNAGGGGGGGGGLVYAVYNTKSGVGTITASGGAAGAGAGTGANGVAGSSGTVIELVN